mgnify:CR=1 FL=1
MTTEWWITDHMRPLAGVRIHERKKITLGDPFVFRNKIQKDTRVTYTIERINECTPTGTRFYHHIISFVYSDLIF